jgi:Uncharacterized protein conserved in bacteria
LPRAFSTIQHLTNSTSNAKIAPCRQTSWEPNSNVVAAIRSPDFYRDGFCRTGPEDLGLHTVCVKVTREFLDFSVLDGNDLVTPRPEWGFPGLKPGDKWCVCVTRWKSALDHNRAAPVDLEATHASALEFVTLEELKAHALK